MTPLLTSQGDAGKRVKLSKAQKYWLATLAGDGVNGSAFIMLRDGRYNPRQSEQRTFDALERLGLAEWQQHDVRGGRFNGYAITDAGRQALKTLPGDSHG